MTLVAKLLRIANEEEMMKATYWSRRFLFSPLWLVAGILVLIVACGDSAAA